MASVIGEVAHDLVATRVPVRVAGESETGEAVVPGGREELERVPASAPRGCWRLGGFNDREPPALFSEEIPDREAGLAASHHDHLAPFCHHVHGLSAHGR
jgi:hypothetical protein